MGAGADAARAAPEPPPPPFAAAALRLRFEARRGATRWKGCGMRDGSARSAAEPPGGASDAQRGMSSRATASGEQLSKQQEAELMVRIAAGDAAAAREAIDRFARRIHAVGYRMLGDAAEAEDVAQEAMLRLWRVAAEWRAGEARISTWLHRVALNLCYDRLRKKKGTDLEEAPEQIDPAMSVEDQMEARDEAAELRAALAALPERQRAAIVLRHFEERSNPQIAEALEVSVEAVESLLARGRRALKAALTEARRQSAEG